MAGYDRCGTVGRAEVSKPKNVTVTSDPLLDRMAKAGYEEVVKRTEHLRDPGGRTWETETEALREDWRAIARAILQSSGERGSKLMATPSGDGESARRSVMPFVAYAVVLALLGGSGVALWTAGWGGLPSVPGIDRAFRAVSNVALNESGARHPGAEAAATSGAGPESTAPAHHVPAQEPAVPSLPSQREASNSDLTASAVERPEPRKTTCTADLGPWPNDSTGQAQAIQILLRDLGFYGGTTYGTVGPATRAAIRKFQLVAHEAETGEPSEMLFEALKRKKCASSAP
jgi:hypothetical protein